MPKSHRPYSPEFKQRIIELVRKGRTPEELGGGSSSPRPRPSVTGCARPIGMKDIGRTAWRRRSRKNCVGCAARTGRSVKSGRS